MNDGASWKIQGNIQMITQNFVRLNIKQCNKLYMEIFEFSGWYE